ncbi:MAG: DegT/DnrJ/EryC1/StrS aminotransferase, partial [Armatimonadota bacterium]
EYGVGCVIANPPVYESQPLIRKHTAGQELPLADELGKRLFCPSLHPLMTDGDNAYVCAALIQTVERLREAGD